MRPKPHPEATLTWARFTIRRLRYNLVGIPEIKTDAHLVIGVVYDRSGRRDFLFQLVAVTSIPDEDQKYDAQDRAKCESNTYESREVIK
jgi:hypothetical protein